MSQQDNQFVALTRCFFCGEADKIIIHKRLLDISKFDHKVIDHDPCPKCKALMEKGILIISGVSSRTPSWGT